MNPLTEAVDKALTAAVHDAFGVRVEGAVRLAGGDTAASYRFDLDDGRRIFAKTHPEAPTGFFVREALDLVWLDEAKAVRVPAALAVGDQPVAFLALEWIEPGAEDRNGDADLGRSLAALHRAGADSFGRRDGHTTGSLGLPNDPFDTWVEFAAEDRLLPLARIAHDRTALPDRSIARIEQIAHRLAELGGPPEPPARLHGDLWAGNRMIDVDGVSWLIDPAAHGGHREFDLAMMRLFGGFASPVFEAYDESFPLADGWQRRVPLHQLAPLVVHAVKFGGRYAEAVSDALDALG